MNFKSYNYTEEQLQARIAQIIEKQSKNSDRREALKTIFLALSNASKVVKSMLWKMVFKASRRSLFLLCFSIICAILA